MTFIFVSFLVFIISVPYSFFYIFGTPILGFVLRGVVRKSLSIFTGIACLFELNLLFIFKFIPIHFAGIFSIDRSETLMVLFYANLFGIAGLFAGIYLKERNIKSTKKVK